MRVEIRHRNERRKHFIDLAVRFSEEERRLVTMSGLQTVEVDLTPGILASSHFPFPPVLVPIMFFGSPLLFLGGCVSTTIAQGGFGIVVMLAAIGVFAFSIYSRVRLSHSNITTISINNFFEDPIQPVLVQPVTAAVTTAQLKRRFGVLKQIIEENGNLTVEVLEL